MSNFGLMEGEYVGLPTATWSLENFSVEDYEALKEQIRSGEIEVSNATEAMPEVSITVNDIQKNFPDCIISIVFFATIRYNKTIKLG